MRGIWCRLVKAWFYRPRWRVKVQLEPNLIVLGVHIADHIILSSRLITIIIKTDLNHRQFLGHGEAHHVSSTFLHSIRILEVG
jgi:hypothetical protein